MDWLVAFLIIAPAGILYAQKSSRLIDYLVWVTVLNRGIRRYIDWSAGSFNTFSPISLTPLIISGLLLLMVLENYATFPAYLQRILSYFGIALGIAFFVGLIRNQLAAVYSLAEYVSPVAVMGCAAMAAGNEKTLDRWIRTVGWAAVAASIYGWYQYFTIPPWDAFWVRAVGFEGYLGHLKPTEMTVFSTMSDRGPLAGFLAFAVIPMMVAKRWRNMTGWVSIVVILATILLTFVRTAIITIGLTAILFPVLNRGKNSVQIVVILCVVAIAANFGLSHLPGSDKIDQRLQTLQTLTQDGSFQGRIDILKAGIGGVIKDPIGTGLGSTGLAGRVNTGGLDSNAVIGDNGYLDILYTFGWLGSGFFFYTCWLIWKQVRDFEKVGIRSESSMMFKALFVTGVVVLYVGNWIPSTGSMVFFIFAGYAVFPKAALVRYKKAAEAKRLQKQEAEGMPTFPGISGKEAP